MSDIKIRVATTDDAEKLLTIYSYYVEKTAVSFEYDVPSLDEFRNRIKNIESRYPYLVAVIDDEIVGYCYAGTFKARKAYDWSVEVTVYIDKDKRGLGIGKELYDALEKSLKAQGILNLNACIAVPCKEDIHLTDASEKFHSKMGFEKVGTFHNSGYKFNTWYDMIWMEKIIGKHTDNQPQVKLFKDISGSINYTEI